MPGARKDLDELSPRIVVMGVGGAGCNAVNNMIDSQLTGVEFIVANTDSQALARSNAEHRLQLGDSITEGLGAGARPEVGAQAARDSLEDLTKAFDDAHMLFITAGMGGGTGTGGAPIIAEAAREKGILTVGVVTKPFDFEGRRRMATAEAGITELEKHVDTLIVIPNQNLFRVATEKTTFAEAFKLADDVLYSGVRGITDLMTRPGLINLDFADVRTVMNEMGKAMMGTGEATGERRAVDAARAAVSNPLLDDVTLRGARAVLINITGGHDMTLYELDEAANEIRSEVDPNANIIIGSAFDEGLEGRVRVSCVATGIDAQPPARQPAATAQAPTRTMGRVVDPMAEEPGDHDDVARPRPDPASTPSPARPAAAREPARETARESGSPFALFGRRKKSGANPPGVVRATRREDEERPAPRPAAASEDEFDESDLEIPAFLRRQT